MWRPLLPLVLAAASVHGQSGRAATTDSPHYRIDHWTTDHGLPSHSVSDIAQTHDGYLWLATTGGLVRFDGYEFRAYTSANTAQFPENRVGGLYAGVGDTLWVRFETQGIHAFAGGRLTRLLANSRGIDRIAQDAQGRVVAGAGTVWRFTRGANDSVARVPIGKALPVASQPPPVPQLWRDANGTLWMTGEHGYALVRVSESSVERVADNIVPVVVTMPSRGEVLTVRAGDAHTGEVVDRAGVVRARYPRGELRYPRLIDGRGVLWVTTSNGIEAYAPGSVRPVAEFPLESPVTVTAVLEDREGNLWFGTTAQGLWRVQRTAFSVMTRANGFRQDQVLALWHGGGASVLAVDASQSIFRIAGMRATPIQTRGRTDVLLGGGLPDGGAFVDSRGTLWVGRGPRSARGMLVGRRAGAPDIILNDRIRTPMRVAESATTPGVLWFHDGAQVYRAAPYRESGPVIDGRWGVGGAVHDMLIARGDTVWLAGTGADARGRLTCICGDIVTHFSREAGLPHNELRALAADADGTLWVGTYGAGIYRYRNGRFGSATMRDGLAEDIVSAIVADDADNFWMAGNRGVQRVARAALNDVIDGKAARVSSVIYTRNDGLQNPETSGGSALRAGDGRIWFPTLGGAAVVDPAAALALDSTPPLVHIEAVSADDDSAGIAGVIRPARGKRRLAFDYTAISLRNPGAVRFEYMLEGFDNGWIDAGSSRRAMYSRVGPGRYTFRVRAVNGGATPGAGDATIALAVPAYFFETVPFFALVAATLLSAFYGAYRYRVRQLEARGATLRRLVDERTMELATAQRRTEESLRTVAAQADQLRSLDQSKSRFFANVSHEFRTPLSLILGPLEDIRDGHAGPVTDAMHNKASVALSNSRRLVRLVDQLLDVAKLEAGAMSLHCEVHDLVAYLRRVAESFASLAERRGVEFVVSFPVGGIPVPFDTDQMDKVLGNLLGNAFKFTPAGGRIELLASVEARPDAAQAVIGVRDSGRGIPPEHLERVFDRFFQVDDSAQRSYEGAGIGLALTKELVELHGGRIDVLSSPGAGSTFVVRLPMTPPGARPKDAPASRNTLTDSATYAIGAQASVHDARDASAAADRTTVLLVEDNAELIAYLREHLERRYRVLEAPNGVIGLALAREHVPDLIVSDIMMPEMDGQTLCRHIKAAPATDFIPVILLTAKAARENRLAGLEDGADDYLTKPVDLRELLVRADNLIRSRRRLRERFQDEDRTLPQLRVPMAPAHFDSDSTVFVRRLYEAMAAHISEEDLQVDDLAAALAMSRRTLYRRVETLLERAPMDLLWDYRLEQAAQWLRETDASVSEVAYGVGFKSVPHFCTRFRDKFGVTPSAFRTSTNQAPQA